MNPETNKSTSQRANELRSGFTLMELLVASSLFIIAITIASGVFIQSIKTQRDVINATTAASNISQAIEQIAREVRTGEQFQGSTSGQLNFTNHKSEKVSYKLLDDGAIGKCVGTLGFCTAGDIYTPITSSKYPIKRLKFSYIGEGEPDGASPRITISLSIDGIQNDINIQTSISSKNIGS